MRWFIISAGIVLILSLNTQAAIINIPEDYLTIQEGIDSSIEGDTVLVQPGTYNENINFNGHNIVLGSLFLMTEDTSYISTTVIDGDHNGRVITFENEEDSTAVIAGFTVQNGKSGISCRDSDPIIINNIISNNSNYSGYGASGGGVYCSNSRAHIINNNIHNNSYGDGWPGGGSDGGGIYCRDSNPIIRGNLIYHNSVYGYYGARGGGIYCNNSNPIITNNTISQNVSNYSKSGIYCYNSNPIIHNSIIWDNFLYAHNNSSPTVTYCDVKGNWEGEGNIYEDPLFIDPLSGNYNIYHQSPCVNAGDPNITDPDGTRSDIGVYFPDHPECFVGNKWHVSVDGNDSTGNGSINNPYRTIQHAVNNSIHGDTIFVQNGTYEENIEVSFKNISLLSGFYYSHDTLDIYNTIITTNSNPAVLTISYCGLKTTLIGFSLKSYGSNHPDGINIKYSKAEVRNNILEDNFLGLDCSYNNYLGISNNKITNNTVGGIVSEKNINCLIDSNVIINNNGSAINGNQDSLVYINDNIIVGNTHAGIRAFNSKEVTIRNNQIVENCEIGRGGGIYCDNSDLLIKGNLIAGNHSIEYGGGIRLFNSDPKILNNTIVGNNADVRGGGLYSESSVITFKNNIMWENSAPDHPEIWIDYRNPLIEYCNIQGGGWEGEGNIDINPQFRDIYNGDYHLKFEYCGDDLNSPCIDAGDPSIYDSEVNCNWGLGQYRSDMGAYGGGSQPIITVGMMPDNFPVVVPAGGSFTYEGSLTNHTEEEMNVDVWIRVRTPDGNYIEINRWQNLTVAPGETNTYYPVVQDIPESAPSGDYLYIAVCGQYPELIHSFYGPITVLAPLNGTELKQAWTVTDWIKQQPVEILPSVFSLSINFPNPFNAKTEIKYSVPYKSNIRIDVYNLQGQKVETLIDDLIESGNHSITWNASNYSSGIYFYRLTTGDRSFSKRMTLLK